MPPDGDFTDREISDCFDVGLGSLDHWNCFHQEFQSIGSSQSSAWCCWYVRAKTSIPIKAESETEAAIIPCILMYITMTYNRDEYAIRNTYVFSASAVSGAFG